MIALVLALVAAVALGSPFGEASAAGVEDGSYLSVTVAVEVDPAYAPDYVVVHVLNPDGQETFPLGPASGNRFTGTFTVLPFNRAVAFEVGRQGEFSLSKTVSLLDLGVDPDQLQTTFDSSPSTTGTRRWGWLALAAGALAGAALLVWWVWPREPTVEAAALIDKTGRATVIDDTD